MDMRMTGPCSALVVLVSVSFASQGMAQGQSEQKQAAPCPVEAGKAKPDCAQDGGTDTTKGTKPTSQPVQDEPTFTETKLGLSLLKNLALDQKAIWTSPTRLRWGDADWLVPFGGITLGVFAADGAVMRSISHSPTLVNRSREFSNVGVGALIGAGGGLYVWGHLTHDDHRRETGLLSGEALADALAVSTTFQYAFGRQRPFEGNGGGAFFHGGTSFPSDHATAAWSVASVIAHEYPGTVTKVLVYGLATAVSFSRVTAQQHFPSDVLIGSAIGWFAGFQVYKAHHDPELGGGSWEDFSSKERSYDELASTFVPLDSWVYPAFERLAALGYVTTALQGMKPWTRMECARLTNEAGEALDDAVHQGDEADEQAAKLHRELAREFGPELKAIGGDRYRSVALDSVYARAVSISGPPLTDGYHFGQTVAYDFGRPFERGFNAITGGAVRANYGPFAIYVRAEYEHAPSAPALSAAVRQVIAQVDGNPVRPAIGVSSVDRVTFLDAYVTYNFKAWQASFGRQSLSWGVGEGGGMLFSDNAQPIPMFRVTRVVPARLPGFLSRTGPFRVEMFLGKLEGGVVVPHRWIYGHKFTFKVGPHVELGYGRTVILGGNGGGDQTFGLTWANFLRSFFAAKRGNDIPGVEQEAFDVLFYVPGTSHRLSLYGDLYERDQVLYFLNPTRGAYRDGIYLARLPVVSKLDFRVESTSSEAPALATAFSTRPYFDGGYRDGYTSNGVLLGDTVGRMGRSIQAWTTYHFSPTHTLELHFQHRQVDPRFIAGGGRWQDYGAADEYHFKSGMYVKSSLQIEHIASFPLLFSGKVNNVTTSIELGYMPGRTKQ